jgi:ATP-dependent Clp protease ATP-binding subunit ClpA
MPSSKDRQRVEIPTSLYDRLKLMAENEGRPLTSLLQDLVRLGLESYKSLWMPRQFMNRFASSAQRALALARDEAHALNHDYVGTEHLLLGLLREGDGIAARVLRQLWIDIDQVRQALVYIMTTHAQNQPVAASPIPAGELATETPAATAPATAQASSGESAPLEDPDLTLRARKVLALAVDEAQRLHQDEVGTEHLLLALAREGEGLAAGILQTFGALGKVREFTLAEMYRRDAPPADAQPTA